MPFPFAAIQRAPAGPRETPAVFRKNSGTAAGRVGVAVPLALAASCLVIAGCADVRRSAYFPESMTTGVAEAFDVHGRAVSTGVSTSFKWRFKPTPVIPAPATNPNLTLPTAAGTPHQPVKATLQFIHRLLLRWNREHSHVLLACGYGLYLWIAQSFATTQGPGLHAMSQLAQTVAPEFDAEALWGSVMIGSGLLALLGMLTGQTRVRQIASALLAALWLLMAACFWTANPRSPGCVTYVVLALAALTRACQIGDRRALPPPLPVA